MSVGKRELVGLKNLDKVDQIPIDPIKVAMHPSHIALSVATIGVSIIVTRGMIESAPAAHRVLPGGLTGQGVLGDAFTAHPAQLGTITAHGIPEETFPAIVEMTAGDLHLQDISATDHAALEEEITPETVIVVTPGDIRLRGILTAGPIGTDSTDPLLG
jgi:hypothetical protein